MKKGLMVLCLLLLLPAVGSAKKADFGDVITEVLQTLKVEKGDGDLLLLTNATYVMVDGALALPYLDTAQQLTGCTVGGGNLLFFQRSQHKAFRLLLMKKSDSRAVIVSRDNGGWVQETVLLDLATISASDFLEKAKKELVAGSDISTLAVISAVWAKGGPYDFLKSAELHNHICPGLTSGYLIAHYIMGHYPLQKNEKYIIIASPVWCKEDAFQVVLDCTAGKHGIVVKPLSDEQKAQVVFDNPAGMVLVWNSTTKTGKGHALTYDSSILTGMAPADSTKAARVLAALDHLDTPDRFVATAASFDLDEALYNTIIQAGSNPYKAAGLVKK
jgi:formylmethanofuran dehydrogenase subunit E